MTKKVQARLTKLDKRHNGNMYFTHRVTIEGDWKSMQKNFVAARTWLWEQFGPSCEVGYIHWAWIDNKKPAPKWAWDSEYNHMRLYLTEEVLTQFLLIKERYEVEYV
jgi:hypothetical protein